mmetsp:Transcript_3425/g.7560  ORF Transcript_3425/g.7560 Transcript_3425/m.7560 type:complete len:347 (-) Transcript_3425:286-1326(-)
MNPTSRDDNGTAMPEHKREQLDDYYEYLMLGPSKSCEETSSLDEEVLSPHATRRKSRTPRFHDSEGLTSSLTTFLPPLHPHPVAHAPSVIRRQRTGSTDTLLSTGSSVVSVDAGKHGFITHDDASSTGSLVLGYEQGREVPPAEYDLPKSILGVYDAIPPVTGSVGSKSASGGGGDESMMYSVASEQSFHLLPYHIRSRLNLSQQEGEVTALADSQPRGWNNQRRSSIGYGSVEEGHGGYDSTSYGHMPSQVSSPESDQNLCYSSETSPFMGVSPYMSNPQMHMMQDVHPTFGYENHYQQEPFPVSVEEANNNTSSASSVYLSMMIALILFAGMIYGLFYLMKLMP